MLVLTRKVGESVVIDGVITIRLEEVRGDRARISFEAPPNVIIHRQEIQDKIAAQATTKQPAMT